jgi:hypothetical protein
VTRQVRVVVTALKATNSDAQRHASARGGEDSGARNGISQEITGVLFFACPTARYCTFR